MDVAGITSAGDSTAIERWSPRRSKHGGAEGGERGRGSEQGEEATEGRAEKEPGCHPDP